MENEPTREFEETKVDTLAAQEKETEQKETEKAEEERAEAQEAKKAAEQFEVMTEDPKAVEAMLEDAVDALGAKKLTGEESEDLKEIKKGMDFVGEMLEKNEDVGMKEMLSRILEERYKMTLSEFLGAFKATKVELVTGQGLPQEAGVWVASKILAVEPADLDYLEKVEFRAKVGGDALKLLGMITKYIPEAQAASVLASESGAVASRIGQALEKTNNNPDATMYDSAKELTLAALPRGEDGAIDMGRVSEFIQSAGENIVSEVKGGKSDSKEYLLAAGKALVENPDQFIAAIKALDGARK